ncbi:hypothetical protein MSAN_01333800 [Mycena sanguinolenta]|uniref:Uncharacterized protein n=1 Tax=Mycena sanguinolenta TaxID=230812 RepID=A0A8H6YAF4_9AGAR|nr:hypothetical protein MSAN_01333800 [Mycena sanguinolenta]
MRVPQELVHLIVDNLHDDIPSLESCSLTARSFVSSAQTYLFNKVEILPPKNRDDPNSPCRKFHKLLTSSPHIAPLVDELEIVLVGSETSFAYDEDGDYLEERHVPWVMSGRTLSLVLSLLDLKRISLVENSPSEWNDVGEFSMSWNRLGRSLKAALTAVFSSPKLKSVRLRGIVVESPAQLLSLFSEATSLREMSIARVRFTQRWNELTPWPDFQPWHPQLQSLLVSEVDSDHFCRYFLHPRIDLTHIKSLTIATELNEYRERLAQAAISAATQHLAIYRPHWTETTFKSILTSNLRSMNFFSTDLLRLLPDVFAACAQNNSRLEKLVFEAGTYAFKPELLSHHIDARIESAVAHLSALKSVEIKAFLWADDDVPFPVWALSVRNALPSLVGRGLLTLTEIKRAYENPHYGWE